MGSLTSIQETFFEECEELLESISTGLALMQSGEGDADTTNAVFRAVHSIKGGAGAFALTDLVAFAHRFETVLDGARAGRIRFDADAFRVLFRAADHLADHVVCARTGQSMPVETTAAVLETLDEFLTADDLAEGAAEDFSFFAIPLDLADMSVDIPPTGQRWLIRLEPGAAMFENGHEPAWIVKSLGNLGELEVRLVLPVLPDWRDMDLCQPVLSWTMQLVTDAAEGDVAAVFEFVVGLCQYSITPEDSIAGPRPQVLDKPATAKGPSPETGLSAGDPSVLDRSTDSFGDLTAARPDGWAEPAPSRSGTDKAASNPVSRRVDPQATSQTLRVELDRVDRLINAVGELITNHAAIAQNIERMALPTGAEVKTHVEDYRMLARDIQEAIMAIRAQPVGPLFQRLARIVREAADATGKTVKLVTTGDNTEVDKTVIERLADPLTHMIRNAIDHGLESTEGRLAAGKPAQGTVMLSASHRSGRVVITLRDDGAGLNRTKILETARRKGLVPQDSDLTDTEIDALLFLPGFSTASTVSNLSGRGVGLDVVRTAVAALGGRITISTIPGEGTEFTLSVPLTLAVMDGMVVSVANQTMVVPIASILETIRPEVEDLNPVGTDRTMLAIRGRFVPIIDVADSLGLTSVRPDDVMPLLLMVEAEDKCNYALAVDDVQDQRQIVIKGLDANYGAIRGVSAATVLGNGQIALILDTDAITSGHGQAGARKRLSSPNEEGLHLASH